MAHQLTSSGTSGSNTQTINYIGEAALEQLNQDFTGNTFGTACLRKEQTELTLQHAIGVFCFLLFSQLLTILRVFLTTVHTMLTRSIITTVKHLVGTEDCLAKTTRDA